MESVSNLLELEEEFLVRALTQTNIMTEGKFVHQQVHKSANFHNNIGPVVTDIIRYTPKNSLLLYIKGWIDLGINFESSEPSVSSWSRSGAAKKSGLTALILRETIVWDSIHYSRKQWKNISIEILKLKHKF